ncbi:MAG TPA: LptF/LptG family permease, partial [Phenylobacterium sp.]
MTPGKVERYVMGRTFAGVGAALAVITAVVILVQFVDLSRSLGVRADTSVAQLFGLTMLRAPAVLLVLLPFVFLFGTMAAYVGLNRRSELVAMRA